MLVLLLLLLLLLQGKERERRSVQRRRWDFWRQFRSVPSRTRERGTHCVVRDVRQRSSPDLQSKDSSERSATVRQSTKRRWKGRRGRQVGGIALPRPVDAPSHLDAQDTHRPVPSKRVARLLRGVGHAFCVYCLGRRGEHEKELVSVRGGPRWVLSHQTPRRPLSESGLRQLRWGKATTTHLVGDGSS